MLGHVEVNLESTGQTGLWEVLVAVHYSKVFAILAHNHVILGCVDW